MATPVHDAGHAANPALRASVEATLETLWRQEFGRKGQDTSGHILQMNVGLRRIVRFVEQAEQLFGAQIPLTAAIRLGTIEALASAIRSGDWPAPSPLMKLRDGRADKVLFIVSAGSGMVVELCELAMLIDFPGQIWALQLPGIDGEGTPLTDVRAMARFYVEHILRSGHRPPFHLFGYSFGGLVTIEMARILKAQGHPTGMVGLIDTTCYERFWPRSEWLAKCVQVMGRRLAHMRTLSARDAASFLIGRIAAVLRHIRRRIHTTRSDGQATLSIYHMEALRPNFQRIYDASVIAFESYDPTPIDCKITLFKSVGGDAHACDPVGIWKRLVSELEVVMVPGTHITMIRKPVVTQLAREISQRLT